MNFGRTLFVAFCVLGTASASQAGIINGSFEDLRKQNGEAQSFGSGNWGLFTEVMGWTSTGPNIEIGLGSVYGVTGYAGQNVLELDSTANAVVSQIVAAPGGQYTLSFLAALRNNVAPGSGLFNVYWNDVLVDSYAPLLSSMTTYSKVVTAAGTNTLRFEGAGTSDSYGAIIDDVQLTSVPDGGATVALLGLTLGGLGFLRRRML